MILNQREYNSFSFVSLWKREARKTWGKGRRRNWVNPRQVKGEFTCLTSPGRILTTQKMWGLWLGHSSRASHTNGVSGEWEHSLLQSPTYPVKFLLRWKDHVTVLFQVHFLSEICLYNMDKCVSPSGMYPQWPSLLVGGVSWWQVPVLKGLWHKALKRNTHTRENCQTLNVVIYILKNEKEGFPWWRSGWESACQCRGHGFEPWSRKIPHAVEQLGPCTTTTEPAL